MIHTAGRISKGEGQPKPARTAATVVGSSWMEAVFSTTRRHISAVADPGALVVAQCHRKGVRVVPLVGPSSIIMSVMASGLNGQSFAFNGYLPVKEPDRSRAIKRYEGRALAENQSQLFIEAPYRNVKLYEQLLKVCAPTTLMTIAVDITAPTESILTRSIAEWRKQPLPDINKRPAIFILGK